MPFQRAQRALDSYLAHMPDAPIPSLSHAREQKINELSTHFANDDLTLEDLERRIERVYKAANVSELEDITADLRAAVAPGQPPAGQIARRTSNAVQATASLESGSLRAFMGSTKRVGRWAVPRRLEVSAILSDTHLDFTHAVLPPGIIEMDVRAIAAAFKLVVPPGMRVIMDMHAVMSSVESRADDLSPEDVPASPGAPIVRLTGTAFWADVKVVVRRRELTAYGVGDDEDDD